jgi:hypothetical protein
MLIEFAIAMLCGIILVSWQIYVNHRPPRPVYVHLAAPSPRHIWIEVDWRKSGAATIRISGVGSNHQIVATVTKKAIGRAPHADIHEKGLWQCRKEKKVQFINSIKKIALIFYPSSIISYCFLSCLSLFCLFVSSFF